ncbi:MAG: N-acetylmuramoyl-L-alanine amidase [Kiritimatiellae bacterium]|nr:N-acetylmuramoyl-L-alanine amidase [Kiritimatiellia bacterium]
MAPVFRPALVVAVAALLACGGTASAAAKKAPPAKKPAAAPAKPGAGAKKQEAAFSTKWRSPRNKQRPLRKSTRFIVLHTTEGSARGALEKLSANGECHYVVDEAGRVYTIVDRGRVAYHAGVSMWNGTTDLDACSIGIEVVGYHDKEATAAQFAALKRLVGDLKRVYKVPDERILTHSMVAYGEPNRWQKKKHRGRKRCGMLFASASARKKLGLAGKPAFDPDVRAGRLVNGDPELARILYGQSGGGRATGEGRASPSGLAGKGAGSGNKPAKPGAGAGGKAPAPGLYAVTAGKKPLDVAGSAAAASTTFWFPPDGSWSAGSSLPVAKTAALPAGTRVLVGYRHAGTVSAKKPVFSLCGPRWNKPDTYYYIRGKLRSGSGMDEKSIPAGTPVFVRDAK